MLLICTKVGGVPMKIDWRASFCLIVDNLLMVCVYSCKYVHLLHYFEICPFNILFRHLLNVIIDH